jgi:Domain of unknown function (DUF4386)
MTRRMNAKVAGVTYLLYIVLGISSLILGGATSSNVIGTRLTLIGQNVLQTRIELLLSLTVGFVAITLAVSLYGLTRDEDNELAVIGLVCRGAEGLMGVLPIPTLGLLWLATTPGSDPSSTVATQSLATFLVQLSRWQVVIAATLFAAGSTVFCYLLLRGRMIPTALARLGVFASVLLMIALPIQLVGVLRGPVTQLMWLPMLAFEVPVALWLIIKGVTPSRQSE